MAGVPSSSRGGGLSSVTDGTHTVTSASSLSFTSGATVTDGGGGLAQVAISAPLVKLVDDTLASDGTFDEQSISQAYTDLLLVLNVRCSRAATLDDVLLRFNNDSNSRYGSEKLYANATTAVGVEQTITSVTSINLGHFPGTTAVANYFGALVAWIPGYSVTTWVKTVYFGAYGIIDTGSGNQHEYAGGGTWNQTTAISRIQIFGSTTANLLTGSRLRIYGRL